MTNPLLPFIQAALSVAVSPLKTALTTAETDPQAALSTLGNLAASEVGNLPAIENTLISEGAQLGLNLLADLEAKLASLGTTAAAAAPAPTPAPETAPVSSAS